MGKDAEQTEKTCHRQVEQIHLTMIAFSGGYLV